MQLAERAAPEVHVTAVEHHDLLGAQPGVIQRAEQRIVPGGRAVLAGGRNPRLEELEERRHPLRRRRRLRGRCVVADVARGVELVQRTGQPHPERCLDLRRFADLENR
ncbi:hypothetical protein HYG77_36860 (plasmid) [Rhodococcus sp. ZPP]|nr:hypothetical protein HYG77_36860 [Rhodococcus sp. ZPP]